MRSMFTFTRNSENSPVNYFSSRKETLSFYLLLGYFLISSLSVNAQICPPLQITCPPNITVCADGPTGACNLIFYQQTVPATVTLNFADRLLSYNSVSINGGGDSAIVAPGSPVSLHYNFSVSYDAATGYCPGCIVQSSIGIGSTFQTLQCETGISNGSSSSPTVNFTAPSVPGIYYLTQEGSLDYFCQEFKFNNSPANAIGVLIVGPPSPSTTGGCGTVTITNNAPACFPVGTTPLTWTATDVNGNTSTCIQNITVLPATVYYRDRDGDGFGNPDYPVYACSQPTGFILDHTDCNDFNAAIHVCPITCNMTVTTATRDSLIVCSESGITTGDVHLIISNGVAPFTVTGADTTNLAAGVYHYHVVDANGCMADATVQVIVTNCIVPYYQPPANDTINTVIGSELTQLYNYPNSLQTPRQLTISLQ